MNIKQVAIIGLSLSVAGAAFIYAKNQGAKTNIPTNVGAVSNVAPKGTIKVLVAKHDLVLGEKINPESFVWQDWPSTGLAPAFISQDKNPKAMETYINAIVKIPMVTGEPVIVDKLVMADGSSGVMSALLTPGMRAVAVSIKADTSVAGFVLPDNRVDVMLTRTIAIPVNGTTANRTVSSTILENVRVLAIDQRISEDKGQKAISGVTATLELSPSDSEKLSMADSLGEISLTLRSYADAAGPTVSKSDALALVQPLPPKQDSVASPSSMSGPVSESRINNPAPAASNVKVYRGGQ